MTVAAGPRLLLEVTLDLRRAQVGSYFPGHGARERQWHILLPAEGAKPLDRPDVGSSPGGNSGFFSLATRSCPTYMVRRPGLVISAMRELVSCSLR